jgi:DDE superfamily endonuclease/Helix-turn-helix of DDE superfamily endonuclease
MKDGPFPERIGLPHSIQKKRTADMYHTTGFSKDEIIDLCAMVSATEPESGINHWPPILGLFKSVAVTLTYLRRNHVQAEIAEYFGVSQSTISRAITGLTPIVARMLADQVPVAEDLDHGAQYIIDGTLLPCWSWHAHPELYAGKHKTTGINVQVACDLYGTLQWVSDPVNGNRHDSAALEISGLLDGLDLADWIGDKGYIGNGMLTPIRKPQFRDLLDWEKEFNKQVNRIRYLIERAIANLKTWRILHVDCRRPLASFVETISAVIALEFYRITCE